ncbi:ABC transporter substrate-binding protein [Coralliovum pocilloporae]|uniref:ABC transporter substrate-binding protein n=1 Tax=Coralliovum pocilloporae TaxID=3066369 RepID=UPI0033071E29
MKLLKSLTLAASTLALAAASANAGEIKVGSAGGVTGPIAELVGPILAGRNLAVKHVNDNGGLLKGDTMTMVVGDSACDPKAAVDTGNKLVNVEQVVGIVGPSCSGATSGLVQSVSIPAGVAVVSDSATAPSITELKDNGTVFRVAPSDAYQGAALAKIVFDAGVKSVAVTYANDDYNAGLAGVFAKEYEALGGKITANQAHEPNKASYRSELSTLAGGKPDALALFAYYGSSGISIVRNSLENGLFSKFYAADGMMDKSVIEQIGAENLKGRMWISQPASDQSNASHKAFAAAYKETGNDPAAPYAAHGYDAAFLMALAIEKAGSADRAAIPAALASVSTAPGEVIRPGEWAKAKALIAEGKDINYEGATGAVDFDGNGDVAGIYDLMIVGDDGTWQTR